jgi:hypothetical protein
MPSRRKLSPSSNRSSADGPAGSASMNSSRAIVRGPAGGQVWNSTAYQGCRFDHLPGRAGQHLQVGTARWN